jgi:hypothetical protein
MFRSLSSLAAACALAAAATAQCLQNAGGSQIAFTPHTAAPVGDEGRSAPLPLGFAFPMAGSAAGSYTHAVVETNGALYLTNGGPASGLAGSFTYGTLQNLQGPVGASPRIAPMWTDLVPGPNWAITINTSVPGVCTFEWLDVVQFGTSQTKSFQARLFQSGQVEFTYRVLADSLLPLGIGVSIGNAIVDVEGISDLSNPVTSNDGLIYQLFLIGQYDLAGVQLRFVPTGSGGYTSNVVCTTPVAAHVPYGRGCYDIPRDSFYQLFATPAAASASLDGQSMTLLPIAGGYSVQWGGGSYVPPSVGASTLLVLDDQNIAVSLSTAMPVPGGSTTVLQVNGNAVISSGPEVLQPNSYTPNANGLLNHTPTSWYSWHDYNVSEGGAVRAEEIGGVMYVTWENAESYPPTVSNPSTMQFQFEVATGVVRMVWVTLTPIGTGLQTQFPEQHAIGWSPGGPSLDPGAISLPSQLPLATQPDILALSLGASPLPTSSAAAGSTVVYRTTNMPEAVPGFYLGVQTFSLSAVAAPGIDLGFLGAPGCAALVGSGVSLTLFGTSSTQVNAVTLPAGLPIGTQFYSQSAALFPPNSLPNGQNAFGLLTSNGLISVVAPL